MKPRDRVIQLAADIACGLSAGQAAALAADIEAQATPRRLSRVAGLASPAVVLALTEAWRDEGTISPAELGLAIRCAAVAVKTNTSYEKVELIYTGPGIPDIRRNRQAMLEVVRSARLRLWVVSYALVGVNEALAALEERALAGVTVNVVVDHRVGNDEQAKDATWTSVSSRLRSHAPSCRILLWPENKRPVHAGRAASLHAKCAVADGRQAFVSSANLTDAAMERNLEVGYLVTGGTSPRALDYYFSQLLADAALVAV